MSNTAERMMALFPASQRAHVTYNIDPSTHTVRADGKIGVRYRTVRKPIKQSMWKRHLAGTYPIVAGLACDGTSRTSVVDIDDYNIDALEIVGRINAHKLPFAFVRSKSGGGHVYAFHDTPISVDFCNGSSCSRREHGAAPRFEAP
jgi:hypothetical protein